MRVRIAKENDLESIVEIYNQAVDDKNCTADLEHVSVQDRKEWFKDHLPERYPILVIEDKSQICGWYSLSPHRCGRKALDSIAEISFYIHKEFRKKGAGTLLMEYALKASPSLGFKNLYALLLDINKPSIQFLKKNGFVQWGHFPEIADMDGKICGQFLYGKRL